MSAEEKDIAADILNEALTSRIKKKAEVETGDGYSISLSELLKPGISIVDIHGYVTNKFGDPVFKLCKLVLSDGESVFVEGELDMPYLDECAAIPEGQLEALFDEEEERRCSENAIADQAASAAEITGGTIDDGWRTFATFEEFCAWAKGKKFETYYEGITSPICIFASVDICSMYWVDSFGNIRIWWPDFQYREVK
jgi:hypothetical protein